MAGDRAGRRQAHGINRIRASTRTDGHNPTFQIWLQVLRGRDINIGLVVYERPLLFGCVNLPEVADAGGALGGFGLSLLLCRQRRGPLGLLCLGCIRLPCLQRLLLLLRDEPRGFQLLDKLLICLGQLLRRFAQLADLVAQAEQVLIFTPEPGDFRRLRVDVGGLALFQFGAQLFNLEPGVTRFGLGRTLLLVGRKEKKFANYQRDDAQPENPAFQCHGQACFRPFDGLRQIRNCEKNQPPRRPDGHSLINAG